MGTTLTRAVKPSDALQSHTDGWIAMVSLGGKASNPDASISGSLGFTGLRHKAQAGSALAITGLPTTRYSAAAEGRPTVATAQHAETPRAGVAASNPALTARLQ